MKIQALTVENYKSFKKLDIKNFKSINMVYGYNNSGKSNLFTFLDLVFTTTEVMETIAILPDGTEQKRRRRANFWEKEIIDQPFIFRRGATKPEIKFSITVSVERSELKGVSNYAALSKEYFKAGKGAVTVKIAGKIVATGEFNALQKLERVTVDGKEIYNGQTDLKFVDSQALNFNDFQSLMSYFNDCILFLDNDRYFITEDTTDVTEVTSAKNYKSGMFNTYLSYLKTNDINGLEHFVNQFSTVSTNKVFSDTEQSSPFGSFDMEFTKIGSTGIEIMLKNEFGRLPIGSFGTGVQQIIYMLSRIFLGQGKKIILIEEIELNLSPKYQEKFITHLENLLNEGNPYIGQMFFTTHSPILCHKTAFNTLEARINAEGESTIMKTTHSNEDEAKLNAAMTLLVNYYSSVKPKPVVDIAARKAASKKARANRVVSKTAKTGSPKKKANRSKGKKK